MPPSCDPGAWPGPARWIGECIYDTRDAVGLAAGLASIAAWVVAQLPQVVRNARTRSAAALSPAFLAEWLAGDTCNLVGCLLLTSQAARAPEDSSAGGGVLKTQTATAAYFICVDCVLILQFVIYGAMAGGGGGGGGESGIRRRRERAYLPAGSRRAGGGLAAAATTATALARPAAAAPLLRRNPPPPPPPPSLPPLLALRSLAAAPHTAPSAGSIIAWVSAVFYLGSRCAQLAKNHSRGSAEGLARSMFGCAITANLLYGASILARSRTPAAAAEAAPWLAGSLGTVALDCCILLQASWLDRRAAAAAARGEGGGSPPPLAGLTGSSSTSPLRRGPASDGVEAGGGGGGGGGPRGGVEAAVVGVSAGMSAASLERRPLLGGGAGVAGE